MGALAQAAQLDQRRGRAAIFGGRTRNGPTLTIEGRDAAGNPRGWYVRLWNYAKGSPSDAAITLDFDALTGYALRSRDLAHWERVIRAQGFARRRAGWRRGDLLLVCPGPAQIHLGVWTGESLVHADAGIGRIVETPGIPRWPVLSGWLRRCRRR